MKALDIKKNFMDVYMQESPYFYLKEMDSVNYYIAQGTKPLYKYLANEIYREKKNPLEIMDLGSSYGIIPALMRYEISLSVINSFFLYRGNDYPSNKEARAFLKRLPVKNPHFKFYPVDISKPAIQFSEFTGLAEEGFCINLEKQSLSPRLDKRLQTIDLVVSTGCIGYIGKISFQKIFESLKKRKNSPIFFAFSVLRIFQTRELREVFERNHFSLLKCEKLKIKQREFYNEEEQVKTLSLLKERGIDARGLEDKGCYYADFFIAGPEEERERLGQWLHKLENL